MNRPFSRFQPAQPQFRVNGRIRAREVRVIGPDGQQVGIMDLGAAINLARGHGVDLVEISATANPPVCRIVDFGKFKYEQAKRDRDSKKHQHANEVKEIQLSARIDPHDLGIKMQHAIEFLCDDMKVKVALRFRGRELARKENGFNVVNKFLTDLHPWGHPDSEPKLAGKTINVMISPLPKHKRAKNPKETDLEYADRVAAGPQPANAAKTTSAKPAGSPAPKVDTNAAGKATEINNPFSGLSIPTEPVVPAAPPNPNPGPSPNLNPNPDPSPTATLQPPVQPPAGS